MSNDGSEIKALSDWSEGYEFKPKKCKAATVGFFSNALNCDL